MCAARDPIVHYYPHDYAHRTRVCEFVCLAELILGDLVKNSPIRQIKIPAKVSGYTVTKFCSRSKIFSQICRTQGFTECVVFPGKRSTQMDESTNHYGGRTCR